MVASQLPMTAKEAFKSVTEFALATIHVVDYDAPDAHRPAGMVRLSTPDNEELTAELEGASEWLGAPTDELLLAALARTIARTLGEGIVPIDVASERGSLLDAVPVSCVTGAQASATDVLGKDKVAGRVASKFEVSDIAEATALALMEDITLTTE